MTRPADRALGDALARVMVSSGLSSFEVAHGARVAVDDVRSVLAGNATVVHPADVSRIRTWVAEVWGDG